MSTVITHTVVGMTCDHCKRAVTDEVTRIEGVTDVEVDLATGRVVVTSEGDLDPVLFATAIDEAGYEVAV